MLLLTEKSSVRLVPVVSLLFGSILWRGCVWSRWLWSIDSHSMLEFWRSDRDGLELMSDKAGDLEPWLMSLARESLVLELPSGFLPSLGEVSPCCFRIFLRYFALAFWNHTYKRNKVFNDHFFGVKKFSIMFNISGIPCMLCDETMIFEIAVSGWPICCKEGSPVKLFCWVQFFAQAVWDPLHRGCDWGQNKTSWFLTGGAWKTFALFSVLVADHVGNHQPLDPCYPYL